METGKLRVGVMGPACWNQPLGPSVLPAEMLGLQGLHIELTFGFRPLGLGVKQGVWENCTVEKAGWVKFTRVFC